jgi:hypothetical protein
MLILILIFDMLLIKNANDNTASIYASLIYDYIFCFINDDYLDFRIWYIFLCFKYIVSAKIKSNDENLRI